MSQIEAAKSDQVREGALYTASVGGKPVALTRRWRHRAGVCE